MPTTQYTKKLSLFILIILLWLHLFCCIAESSSKEKDIVKIKKVEKEEKKSSSPFIYEEEKPPEFTSPYIAFLRAIGSLIIVLILIYITIYVLKLLYKGKKALPLKSLSADNINIIDQVMLQPNKSLHLVDIYGSILLLSVTEAGISVLKEITEKETIEKIRNSRIEKGNLQVSSFKEYLTKSLQALRMPLSPPQQQQHQHQQEFFISSSRRTPAASAHQVNNINNEKLRISKENILYELKRIRQLREKEK